MSKGFVMMAIGDDYVAQACLCAMSIKQSGNMYPVSIITNNKVPSLYQTLFDKIIEIPWTNKDTDRFATTDRWKIYHASPYEETIVLDTDILVLQSLNDFWKELNNYDLYFVSNAYTYRHDLITSNYYRKAFTENKLPNLYSAVHYFKKGDTSHEFYKWVELVSNNWELFYGQYCKEHYPKAPSMDVTYAIVSKILDIDTEIYNSKSKYPMFVHMKARIQGWKIPAETWQTKVGAYLTENGHLTIGNTLQQGIFHYTENSFARQEFLGRYAKMIGLE